MIFDSDRRAPRLPAARCTSWLPRLLAGARSPSVAWALGAERAAAAARYPRLARVRRQQPDLGSGGESAVRAGSTPNRAACVVCMVSVQGKQYTVHGEHFRAARLSCSQITTICERVGQEYTQQSGVSGQQNPRKAPGVTAVAPPSAPPLPGGGGGGGQRAQGG